MSRRPVHRPSRHVAPDSGDSDAGSLSRRHFLQTALGSSIAVAGLADAANPDQARAAVAGPAANPLVADAFEGTVVGIQGSQITINTGPARGPEALRTTSITPQTSVWEQGAIGQAIPSLGDLFLVRSVIPGQAEMAWTNFVCFDASVLRQNSQGLQVAAVYPSGGEPVGLDVATTETTTWYDTPSGVQVTPTQPLAFVHITGYRLGASVVATRIEYVNEADAEALEANPPAALPPTKTHVQIAPDISACILSWSGCATVFSCPTGEGECAGLDSGAGACNSNYNYQAAWPRTLSVQNCDNGCTSQCALKCGDSFLFYNCKVDGYWLNKADIGPCQKSGTGCSCSTQYCYHGCGTNPCGSGPAPRVVDLTTPTMAAIMGQNGLGCTDCTVAIPCECSDCVCPY